MRLFPPLLRPLDPRSVQRRQLDTQYITQIVDIVGQIIVHLQFVIAANGVITVITFARTINIEDGAVTDLYQVATATSVTGVLSKRAI